jgi:NADPH:quinone reductase-like Zn-dependent oxidoreductase
MEAAGEHMKAAYTRYGPPDVVEVNDLDKPVPRDNEVLIKVHAASVNPLDWKTMTAGPCIIRLLLGLRKPKIKQLGVDVAGRLKRLAGTQRSSKQATRCSAHAAEHLPNMRVPASRRSS